MARRRGPSLAERSATASSSAPASSSGARGARHCWADPPGHPGPWPGLVVEWRKDAGGAWEGRCVYAVTDPSDGAVRVIERWLPAACLTRA